MKAMLIKEYGENAVFEVSEVEKLAVKAGHILVRIAASSVNTVDTMIRKMGKNLPLSPGAPAILGMDFAGTMLIPMLHNYKRVEHAQILENIAQIAEAGALKPLLDETTFKLEEVGKAHARLESGQAIGKVVVEN